MCEMTTTCYMRNLVACIYIGADFRRAMVAIAPIRSYCVIWRSWQECSKRKHPKANRNSLFSQTPYPCPTSTKFCLLGRLPDNFVAFEFQKDRLRKVGAVGGRNFGLPIDEAHRLYNSLLLPHKPWCRKLQLSHMPGDLRGCQTIDKVGRFCWPIKSSDFIVQHRTRSILDDKIGQLFGYRSLWWLFVVGDEYLL